MDFDAGAVISHVYDHQQSAKQLYQLFPDDDEVINIVRFVESWADLDCCMHDEDDPLVFTQKVFSLVFKQSHVVPKQLNSKLRLDLFHQKHVVVKF